MHLSDARLVDIIGGKKDPEGEQHLGDCARCQGLAMKLGHHLEALRSLASESVDDSEMHRLQTLYRSFGPQPRGALSWIATLVRSSAQPAEAVRGASEELLEYAAGPFRMVLQLNPHDAPHTISIHGQLLADEPDAVIDGQVVLVADDGASFLGEVDRFGEFHIAGVRAGTYSASWWLQAGQVHIPELEVSTDAD